jgi:addiction module RelE/StbE family toxin
MTVGALHYHDDFILQFDALPKSIAERAVTKLELFSSNPFHASLRTHKLLGKLVGHWSISINMKYRIIFKPQDNGDILLVSVGTQSIYEK